MTYKIGLLTILAALTAAAAPSAPTDTGRMSEPERAFLLDQMRQSKQAFLESIHGLSQAQWTFKPAPEVWSVEECAEHIILAEDFIFKTAQDTLTGTPVVTRLATGTLEHDRQLAAGLLDRSQKAKAPAAIAPEGKAAIATPAEAARLFIEKRDRHIAYVKKTRDALRLHASSLPGMGPLDSYQLILMMAAHSARHTGQIKEVEGNPNFPAQ